MKPLEHMTKAELLRHCQQLEQRAPAEHPAFERERLLHELQVHQIELETQNRELRESQLLIEASRDRYTDLYDFAPVGYVAFDTGGVIRELNLTAAGMLGAERSRLLNTPFHLYVEGGDLARFRPHLAGRVPSDVGVVTELRLARKDSPGLPVVMQSVRVQDGERSGWQCRASLTDISAGERARAALRQSEERLRLALDACGLGLFEVDLATGQTLWNPTQFTLLGLNPRDASPGPEAFFRAVHPDDCERVQAQWKKALRSGRLDMKFRVVRADGRERWLAGKGQLAAPDPVAGGLGGRFLGVNFDITETVALERQLLEVTEHEQRKFGHDLHDGLGQRLTALELVSHGLAEDLWSHAPALAERAARLNNELRETVTQARLLAHGLAPVPLTGDGLMHGLAGLAASTSRIPGVSCRFVCDPPVLIEDVTVATHLYRIAQEAVTNALKHGQATQVDLTLTGPAGGVELIVKNNGHILPAAAPAKPGMGLRVMHYRAELIGALLAIRSGKRNGVWITCTLRLPVRAP